MFLLESESLDEVIVRLLVSQPQTANWLFLHEDIKKQSISIQGLYKSLRRLIKDGAIVKYRKTYFTNSEWASSIRPIFGKVNSFELDEGSRVTYTFNSFFEVDVFWKNIVLNIPAEDLQISPFYYLPHNFWIHIPNRSESERNYYSQFESQKKKGYMVIGAKEEEDMNFKKSFQSKYLGINTINYSSFKGNEHITVLGDYVTTTIIEKGVSDRIDLTYRKTSKKDLVDALEVVFTENTKIKVIFEKSKRKADKIKQKLSRDFYIS